MVLDKPIITGGNIVGTKGIENKGKERYPQQHVRPGRGVPGYRGDVEVYATTKPASYEGDGGVGTLAKAEKDYTKLKADDLRAEAEKRGLSTGGNRGDLIARLEDDDKA